MNCLEHPAWPVCPKGRINIVFLPRVDVDGTVRGQCAMLERLFSTLSMANVSNCSGHPAWPV
jgi:hypothetical protein